MKKNKGTILYYKFVSFIRHSFIRCSWNDLLEIERPVVSKAFSSFTYLERFLYSYKLFRYFSWCDWCCSILHSYFIFYFLHPFMLCYRPNPREFYLYENVRQRSDLSPWISHPQGYWGQVTEMLFVFSVETSVLFPYFWPTLSKYRYS